MSTATLYRLSGMSLLIGSLLTILGSVPSLIAASSNTIAGGGALLRSIGLMLFVLGLPGMYTRIAQRAGILGLLGFIATLFDFLIRIALQPIYAIMLPFLAAHAPALAKGGPPQGVFILFVVQALLALIGGILLGSAIIRATIPPRWAGLVIIAGALLSFIGNFLGQPIKNVGVMIVLAGFAWLAVGMLSKQPVRLQMELPASGVRA